MRPRSRTSGAVRVTGRWSGLLEDGAGFLERGHRRDVGAAADVIRDEAQTALLVGREDGRRRDTA